MTEKKKTTAERLKELATKLPSKVENMKKGEGTKKHGGSRPGSGRKPTDASEMRRTHLQFIREHAEELVSVKLQDQKTGKVKIVKMTRLAVTMEKVFAEVQRGESWAVREYLDRVLGKATQPIGGDDDMPIVVKIDF